MKPFRKPKVGTKFRTTEQSQRSGPVSGCEDLTEDFSDLDLYEGLHRSLRLRHAKRNAVQQKTSSANSSIDGPKSISENADSSIRSSGLSEYSSLSSWGNYSTNSPQKPLRKWKNYDGIFSMNEDFRRGSNVSICLQQKTPTYPSF